MLQPMVDHHAPHSEVLSLRIPNFLLASIMVVGCSSWQPTNLAFGIDMCNGPQKLDRKKTFS
jgi:hypothetical protein